MNSIMQLTPIDLSRLDDVVYWAKKWEISPNQLLQAIKAAKTNNPQAIAKYLREQGFAL
jgi:predicted nucleic acid-binding Zn ribbon protein